MAQQSDPSARQPLRRNLRQRRYRTRRQRQQSIVPGIPWDVVKLGRWAGIFVLVSALALPIARLALFPEVADSRFAMFSFWQSFVSTGSFGVIILLLAELADRLRRGQA